MGRALYRTYRSSSFDEVIGQEHVTTTLQNALKSGTISHAYLLTGPRGVGKTSVARILAHEVNGLSYQQDVENVDIIEIDAASNRRIDEVRELRENARVVPTSAKYKVYIIDEVHMLTREAFNALLKTLEEPPAHVIFILATTEFHKLPDTIVSRCLRFNFKPIEIPEITAQLRKIADSEGLEIDDQALELLARHGDGSFRDSISALDQIRNVGGSVKLTDVERMIGIPPESQLQDLMAAVNSGQPSQLLKQLAAIYELGVSPGELAKQLGAYLRTSLLDHSSSLDSETILRLLKELLEIIGAPRPKAQLELALLRVLLEQNPQPAAPKPSDSKTVNKREPAVDEKSKEQKSTTIDEEPAIIEEIAAAADLPLEVPDTPLLTDNPWTNVLASLKSKNSTLYSIARMARTDWADDKLTLTFDFAFHHKQVNEPKNKELILGVLRAAHPNIVEIAVELSAKAPKVQDVIPRPNQPSDQTITSITNIFGPGEVLE